MRKAEEFLTAVFTAEGDVDDEARKIVLLLESGVDTVHIRKPGLDEAATAGLIESRCATGSGCTTTSRLPRDTVWPACISTAATPSLRPGRRR